MKIVVFTGAGISAESGLNTFRATDGLWEGHKVEDVAHPSGWKKNPQMVLDFYNERRKGVKEAQPNAAHIALAELEQKHEVTIITQNIDDLHERAGSTNVIHLHGEIFKVRREKLPSEIIDWREDLNLGDLSGGQQLRPHVVWFTEQVLNLDKAYDETEKAEVFMVIGTSAQVFPAANLIYVTTAPMKIFVDPNVSEEMEYRGFQTVKRKAVAVVPGIVKNLMAI
jgi:NAD-dependent deacetylase